MSKRDIFVIGASAGGVEAMKRLLSALPRDFAGTIFFTLHVSAGSPSVLPRLLGSYAPILTVFPEQGEEARKSRLYVAPPDHHMIVDAGRVMLTRGPRENGSRPAINPLFRTAAAWYGARVTGIILTGMLDDGAEGIFLLKRRGGYTIVQDPADAAFPSMPRTAIEGTKIDEILTLEEIARRMGEIAIEDLPSEKGATMPPLDPSEIGKTPLVRHPMPGTPTPFTCPDCGGALSETREGALVKYECHVGHAYGAQSLADGKNDQLELALWTALRTLDENAAFFMRMSAHATERGAGATAQDFDAKAKEAERRALIVRQALFYTAPLGTTPETPAEPEI